MLFPTTVVGSWPRPPWLLRALKQKEGGEIDWKAFNEVADEAVLLALKYQEDAGIDIISDGEQRRDNFYSFVADRIEGIKLMTVAELLDYVEDRSAYEEMLTKLDVPAFAIKSPVVVDRIKKARSLALEDFLFAKAHTKRQLKVTLPGPYMLLRSSWVKGISDKVYPDRMDLARELCALLREEIIALGQAGAAFVQLDEPVLTEVVYGEEAKQSFMCAALTYKSDPSEELEIAKRLVNEVTKGIGGVKLGVHVCRGNWTSKEEALLKGDYAPLLPYLLDMGVDQLVLEFSTPRAGELEVLKEYANEKELGFGVVNPRGYEVEDPAAIEKRVRRLTSFYDPSKVYLNPDCGFGTFAERPITTPTIAYRKLVSMATAAERLRRELG